MVGFTDAEISAEMAARAGTARPSSHRGTRPAPTQEGLVDALRELAAAGQVGAVDGGYRLPDRTPGLGAEMDGRITTLIQTLVAGGVDPPPTSVVAREAGVPPAIVDQLRDAGWVVEIGPRIEYPRQTLVELEAAVEAARTATGEVDRTALRTATGLSHRRADALLEWLDRS
jgi:selenocysteine-specific elongation factor